MPAAQRLPFRYLEPAFFAGLLDDPLLWVRIRPLGRALLFDCGQLAHLAKRVVKPIDTVFVSHAHMDHLMGLPTLVRHHHASPKALDLYGPAGMAERVCHQLSGYDWNLCEPRWCTLRVHEVHPSEIHHYRFSGPQGFRRHVEGVSPRKNSVIWSCRYAWVSAEILDHRLPVLAFRLDERPPFALDRDRLEEQGLVPGPWIRELKNRVWQGGGEGSLPVWQRQGEAVVSASREAQPLYESIRLELRTEAVGYLTDVGWTPANRARILAFFNDLTLLCADCAFLAEDVAKARQSYHLSTRDLNELAQRLVPRFLLPMHLSKSYLRRWEELYRELQPPAATTVLPLPPHVVPPPLLVEEGRRWLRP
ncbi:MAG: MBL fold metallo-hydrolase [Desulfuromonadales bacterium]|nr:MBL fold metallo-hydrolase [Desulfuromonadales bacterium]MDW7757097.1 MBL fold metallo-hydrolase [Desulfuromonadales bacterium]